MNWKLFYLNCFILISFFVFAQTPVYDASQKLIYTIENNQLVDSNQQILFTTQGNIVFEENSTSYKKILFTLDLDSLSQNEFAKIYKKNGSVASFSIAQNRIWYQQNDEALAFITLTQDQDNIAFYNTLNDSLLVFVPQAQLNAAMVFAIAFQLWSDFDLKTPAITVFKNNSQENEVGGLVEPVFGGGIAWVWDGKYLYPYGVNLSHPMVWVFEEDKLAPRNYPRMQEEWNWDGESLRPYWGGNTKNLWVWRNGVLQQLWNSNYQNEYIIEDNVLRKRFGNFGDNEWQIQGNVPLPVLTAIVLGILYR